MNKKHIIPVFLAVVTTAVILAAVLSLFQKPEEPDKTGGKTEGDGPEYITEENQREVILFFQREGSPYLIPEKRKIIKTATPSSQAKQVVAALIAGPEDGKNIAVVPPGCKMNELLLSPEGIAYVDFSEELVRGSQPGSYNEIITIYGIVNSLVLNFREIKGVKILVGGTERDTLFGHIRLDNPFEEDIFLIDPASAGKQDLPFLEGIDNIQTTREYS